MVVLSENKKILISLPGALLDEIDSFTKNEKTNRSEFIREAIKVYIKEKKRELEYVLVLLKCYSLLCRHRLFLFSYHHFNSFNFPVL